MRITLRLDDEIGDQIRALASQSKRSMNRQIEWMLGVGCQPGGNHADVAGVDGGLRDKNPPYDGNVLRHTDPPDSLRSEPLPDSSNGKARTSKLVTKEVRKELGRQVSGLKALGSKKATVIKGSKIRVPVILLEVEQPTQVLASVPKKNSGIPEKRSHDPKTCRMKPCFMCEAMAAKK